MMKWNCALLVVVLLDSPLYNSFDNPSCEWYCRKSFESYSCTQGSMIEHFSGFSQPASHIKWAYVVTFLIHVDALNSLISKMKKKITANYCNSVFYPPSHSLFLKSRKEVHIEVRVRLQRKTTEKQCFTCRRMHWMKHRGLCLSIPFSTRQ